MSDDQKLNTSSLISSSQYGMENGQEVDSPIESLLIWAKRHTEIGNDLMKDKSAQAQAELRQKFIDSLEQGKSLIKQQEYVKNGTNSQFVPVAVPREEFSLPLSGSRRFRTESQAPAMVREDRSTASSNSVASQNSLRSTSHRARMPSLAPSRSYSKSLKFPSVNNVLQCHSFSQVKS